MIRLIEVNYISVLAAAIAYMVLGFLWYSPSLLGKPWMKLRGLNSSELKAEQAKMGPLYGLTFVVSLLTAYILYHVMIMSMAFFGTDRVTTGLTSGFWMWLGFVMPTQTGNAIFGSDNKNKWQLLGIDTSYQLVGLMLMGLVMGYLG
ncbi:MAG: hypothetical protein ACD_30C00049G0001 [uncultured bacterium]|uniref:DUF1761 domain-containing protein n=4 Tax=Candidatus Daviesiibacteriota TaxID=1752718 RepID=A0A0G0EUW1_9BACT|nr:MAG: hypothetical protein ACD_30C00049G0001 [uncultured bacterium]KKQ10703.1 MAG: hypothetical protein US19_C0001G0041 [Candidatus Daviesbacteria bacterium GW2011_GWB1_36_5]KKQ14511.1 MAG: hypothetical protein US28_C0035G0005 [Candidatus Daviesbacteria bacterium GW2011_GWA1_36_8]OGE16869.1 MAG: hypothetical protein A2858_03105 [Candidatus Daviesbacteria bacterium RIFCSPHIGHO2_01_FULL_36_37]OGE31225.1 MAG: hypothetical protein A3C99_01080 [Candidatus Daviesbacteria bacterium RIFCSPHIGHO2_02_F